ncbi:MAG: hypothetical protein LC794_08670 [Acidobacteria bacterium]|nr:hypothetical protein [Acidobacteriota bacterium]
MAKSLLSTVMAVTLLLSVVSPVFAQDPTLLSNADILTMVRAKLPSALIVEKINNSSCAFDTFPSVLAELKYKGVPDEVLMAMVESPHGGRATRKNKSTSEKPREVAFELKQVTIPDGTALEVESTYTVSSGEVEEGSAVSFTVVHPVVIDGLTVVAKGARATARVTKAKKGGSWGRAGQLAWAMQDVIAVDRSKIPLEFSKSTKGDSKGGTVATAVIVTGVLFWPAAPLWGFKKGKDAKVPAGQRFDVVVHGNVTVQVKVASDHSSENE